MILDADETRALYDRTARFYDLALSGYRILGVDRYRRDAVTRLNLHAGDTVVDLGCGTGANLPMLVDAVGPTGRIHAIDISPNMLSKARRLAKWRGWTNIEFIEGDVRDAPLPDGISGVMAAYALEMLLDNAAVIERVVPKLVVGGRFALLGLKEPSRWPRWLVDLAIRINRSFGVTRDYTQIRPWLALREQLKQTCFEEMFLGAGYLCVAEKAAKSVYPTPMEQ